METHNQFVTGRSDERREAMLRRENKALREDIARLRQTAAAEEDLHEKESEQHRQIVATMNKAYHCKIGEILDLRRNFGKANTRISILTAALMESLQIQIKSIEMERVEAVERIAKKHDGLAEQIIKLKNLVAGDENEYALARLRELEENM